MEPAGLSTRTLREQVGVGEGGGVITPHSALLCTGIPMDESVQ